MKTNRENSMKIWMQEMTSQRIRAYLDKDDIVFVPIGSIEVHSEYLPLGTDTYEAIDYASDAARRAGDLVYTSNLVRRLTSPHGLSRDDFPEIRNISQIANRCL